MGIVLHDLPGLFQFLNHSAWFFQGMVDIMSAPGGLIGSIAVPGNKIQGYIFLNTMFEKAPQPLFCLNTTDSRSPYLDPGVYLLDSSSRIIIKGKIILHASCPKANIG